MSVATDVAVALTPSFFYFCYSPPSSSFYSSSSPTLHFHVQRCVHRIITLMLLLLLQQTSITGVGIRYCAAQSWRNRIDLNWTAHSMCISIRLTMVIIIPNLWQQKPDETGKIRCRRKTKMKTNETKHKTTFKLLFFCLLFLLLCCISS